jgi:translocation and assembly module TamA
VRSASFLRAPGALLLLLACACAAAKPPPGEPELKAIHLEGNHALSNSDIKDKIATSEDSWIPFSDAKYLDRAVLQSDTKRIARLYQARGYFSAKVGELKVEPVPGKANVVEVYIPIEEGPASTVGELHLDGAAALPAEVKKEIDAVLKPLAVGQTFDEAEYDEAKAALGRALRNQGYAEATVAGEVIVEPKLHTAAVTFTINPGERYNIGRIVVAGTSKVPRNKVAQEVADAAPPGTRYSDDAVQDAQNRVFDMGVFSLAKVSRGAPDPESHTLPLAVDVREAPFRTLRGGGGFGVERQRQEVRTQGEYINRNFFGGLRRLDFDNRLAYVVTPDVLKLASGEGTQGVAGYSKLTFTQPDLVLNDLDLNLTTKIQRDIQVGYTYNSALAGIGLEKTFGRKLDLVLQYNFQVLQLNIPHELESAQLAGSRAPQLATACPSGSACFLVLEYLEQRAELDLRDNRIQPRKGFYAALDVQEGGGPAASFRYLRLEPEVRGYLPLGKKLVVAQRLQWGWMKAFGDLSNGDSLITPLTQRFFAGGSDSVRAYGSRLESPVAVVCRDTSGVHCAKPSDFQAVPVGGDGLYEATTELRYNLTTEFGVVGFVDIGAVPIKPFEVRPQDVAVAPGIGLRYYTLFGPVRLDLAYRLPNTASDDGQLRLGPSQVVINYPPPMGRGFVSPGRTSRFDFQFSIGEAF